MFGGAVEGRVVEVPCRHFSSTFLRSVDRTGAAGLRRSSQGRRGAALTAHRAIPVAA